VITMSSLPPIEPGDDITVFNHDNVHLCHGVVVKVDDGGVLLGDEYPYWIPWSAVGQLNLSNSRKAHALLAQYRREHAKESGR
jgi:hypothetical protein